MSRKAFQRPKQDERKRALMEVPLAAGLVRHHFGTKDGLITTACAYLTGALTADTTCWPQEADGPARTQLGQFPLAKINAPNMAEDTVSLWARFIGRVCSGTVFADNHRKGLRDDLALLESLIAPVQVGTGQYQDTLSAAPRTAPAPPERTH